jgi:hypothetical protein
VVTALGRVAMRLYGDARGGPNATMYARLLQRSRALSRAVAHDDPAAARAAVLPLLERQLIHVRVQRGNRVLADLGRPDPLAPVTGAIDDAAGRPIGSFALSVQDARAYVAVLQRITGAEVLLRSGARQVLGTLRPGPASVPALGRVDYAGRSYEALSFAGEAYPSGPLRISLLVPPSAFGECGSTRAETIADTLGAVGQRIYAEEAASGAVTQTIHRIQSSAAFRRAVAASDRAATLAAIRSFFRLHQFHIVRVRVLRGSRLLADLGGPLVLGPAQGTISERGRTLGTFLVAVQDDAGYLKLARRFTGADVVMRLGANVAMSTLTPPPAQPLPARGTVRLEGRRYRVFSFTATAFPSGPLRISLLFATG